MSECYCGEIEIRKLPLKEHQKVSVGGKEASCAEDGITAGAYCVNCKRVVEGAQRIASLAHSYGIAEEHDLYTVYKCSVCGDEKREDHAFVPDCGKLFSFDVICAQNEAYIYEHLKIADIFFVGGEYENIYEKYGVQKIEDNVWRITPEKEYSEYVTYRVYLDGDIAFKDYGGRNLTFSVEGPEKFELELNKNTVFLKSVEKAYGGSLRYTLKFDGSNEKYVLTLNKTGVFSDSYVGRVIAIGDFESTEEFISDSGEDTVFGKIEEVREANGATTLILGCPSLEEIYETLDISFEEDLEISDDDIPEDIRERAAQAFMQSDAFCEFITATYLAAGSYADGMGLYVDVAEDKKSIWESLESEYSFKDSVLLVTLTGKFDIPINNASKEPVATLKISFSAKATVTFEFSGDFTTEKGYWDIPTKFTYLTFNIDQNNEFEFEFDANIEYSKSSSEPNYFVNKNTLVIHTTSCVKATKIANKTSMEFHTMESLVEKFKNKGSLSDHECKSCRPITGYKMPIYVRSVNSNMYHCADCIYVKNISVNNRVYGFDIPTVNVSLCSVCKPEEKFLADFKTCMVSAMSSEEWENVFGDVKKDIENTEYDDSEKGFKVLDKNIKPLLNVFNVNITAYLTFDLDLEAMLNYNANYSVDYKYGIRILNGDVPPEVYFSKSEPKKSQHFDLFGKAECKVGAKAELKLGFVGIANWVYAGLSLDAGIYSSLTGVVNLETSNYVPAAGLENYSAAYFEAGIYYKLDAIYSLFIWRNNYSVIPEKRLALVKAGYENVYHSYEQYDKELEITGKNTTIDELDILRVNYLNLPSNSSSVAELSAFGEDGKYAVYFKVVDENGKELEYCRVQSGVLKIDENAPKSFTAVIQVTVISLCPVSDTFTGFLDKTYNGSNSVYKLGTLEVAIEYDSNIFTYEVNEDGKTCTVTGFKDRENYPSEIEIPSEIDGYKVTEIGAVAFAGCTSLTSVTIPNGVTIIGWMAFRRCKSLTSVTIPGSVILIAMEAFSDCKSLTSVTIPSSVILIKNAAFAYCTSLTNIRIMGSSTEIGASAFIGCPGTPIIG